MNLTIATASARTLKTLQTHYLAIFAGATLAITALVMVTSFGVDSANNTAPPDRPVPPVVSVADQKHVTFYLVGSEAERERVIAMEDEAARIRYDNNIADPNASYAVFVVRTPDEVSAATISIYEASSYRGDAIVSVVDLLPAELKR